MPSPTLCYKWFLLILQPPVQWSPPQRGPGGSAGNEPACNVGDLGSIPVLGRSPGEGNSHPLQYSCLEKPMNRGAWRATVHGVTRSRTPLKQLSMHACMFSHYPFFFFLIIRTLKIYPPNNLHIGNTGVLTSQHAVRYAPRTYLLHNWKFSLVTPFTYFFYACIP